MSLLSLISGCLIAMTPAAGPVAQVPEEAYVNRNQTAVRSGPGNEYYATDHLDLGTRVEVYRRDADGWLAIRPPRDSFSLIPARQLAPTATQGVARVRESGVVAWVATRHGPVSNHKWQVKLDAGEFVRVLGQDQVTLFDGAERETVYQVAPPSGEFRWIHQDFVSSVPPDRGPRSAEERVEPALELADYHLEIESDEASNDSSYSQPDAVGAATSEPKQTWRAARRTSASPAELPTRITVGHALAVESESTGGSISRPTSGVQLVGGVEAVSEVPSNNTAPPTNDALQELDVLLSLIVSQPPERWDLADLRARALAMIDNGQTALDRGRARLLLEKITQFVELQQRHQQIESDGVAETGRAVAASGVGPLAGEVRDTPPSANGYPSTVAPEAKLGSGLLLGSAGTEPVDPSTYDAYGLLVPVHSRTRRAPPYAIVDENGQVLKYVSPSPGLNLHRYLGKRIGILGPRGYLPSLEARHVTAQRVVQLDRHPIR